MPSPVHTSAPQTRRSGSEARDQALEAASRLLRDGGPSAVTLKAVGNIMGVSHANLIHHFGSAAGLQGALMDKMVRDLAVDVGKGLKAIASGAITDQRAAVDIVFDAFSTGGAAQVAAWLALARETERAQSFASVVRDLADQTAEFHGGDEASHVRARHIVVMLSYMAFADALIGPALRPMLDMNADTPRNLTFHATERLAET